jgi:hypothetical protein
LGCTKSLLTRALTKWEAFDVLVGPMSNKTARRLSPFLQPYLLQLSNSSMSLQQGSEWVMRWLQGSFPMFKWCLPSDATKQKSRIQSIVVFHNFQTNVIGCNEVKTVFDDEYGRVINIQSYECISNVQHRILDNL